MSDPTKIDYFVFHCWALERMEELLGEELLGNKMIEAQITRFLKQAFGVDFPDVINMSL